MLTAIGLVLLAGCGGAGDAAPAGDGIPATVESGKGDPSTLERVARDQLPARLDCPTESTNCASTRGRILYVEAVDPDGDGDAHFALVDRQGITLPGITVVDVNRDLRPQQLPGPGDYLSAVGPVFRGSYGQDQIEATAIRYSRRAERP